MKTLSSRTWMLSLAAPALALALVVASCAQQAESPVAPSSVRGGTLFEEVDPVPTIVPDPTPEPTPPPVGNCSPGYWKNHEADFALHCSAAAALPGDNFTSCAGLLFAISCNGGPKEGCTGENRQAAASALNEVSGCTESD